MADYYKNVANMLGVELGEIFKINDTKNEYAAYYRFTTEGIEQAGDINDKEIYWSLSDSCILNDLICGKTVKITKLPQKPKKGEMYYVPAFEIEDLYTEYLWNNDNTDKVCYERNVVFKTPEEATRVAKEMLAMLKESEN